MAKLTLSCPHCGGDIELPATVVTSNGQTAQVLVKVDQSVGEAHLAACRAKAKPEAINQAGPSTTELAGRIHRMLDMRAFIGTGGSRACTMCGVTAKDCMVQLDAKGKGMPCCAACGNGDTHPVPRGDLSCAEWAAEHHKADQ